MGNTRTFFQSKTNYCFLSDNCCDDFAKPAPVLPERKKFKKSFYKKLRRIKKKIKKNKVLL